jgi:hypothetical protein
MSVLCLKQVAKEVTNLSACNRKVRLRKRLFQVGQEALKQDGWNIRRVPLNGAESNEGAEEVEGFDEAGSERAVESLTIAEAKQRLAQTFGVDTESVRITIEA